MDSKEVVDWVRSFADGDDFEAPTSLATKAGIANVLAVANGGPNVDETVDTFNRRLRGVFKDELVKRIRL